MVGWDGEECRDGRCDGEYVDVKMRMVVDKLIDG